MRLELWPIKVYRFASDMTIDILSYKIALNIYKRRVETRESENDK